MKLLALFKKLKDSWGQLLLSLESFFRLQAEMDRLLQQSQQHQSQDQNPSQQQKLERKPTSMRRRLWPMSSSNSQSSSGCKKSLPPT
jgi:hypothetical protein